MARYTEAKCRLCRRQQEKLFLKGSKCNTDKCPITTRNYVPGQHGPTKTRMKFSNYGLQMREKQKVKRIYGVLEQQFRKYFAEAERSKGVTGKVLLQLLESRLDNVIFRLGLGKSRNEARQMVRHNCVYVNNHRVNIPSFSVSKDDVITFMTKEKALARFKDNLEQAKDRTVPAWLGFTPGEMKATVLRLPEKTDILFPIEEQLIVELYSK